MANKSILMSIKPQYVAKILNGEKTIEVRKKFPKDYAGWVYLYCTKGKEYLFKDTYVISGKEGYFLTKCGDVNFLNGKVVARFWCDKVEHFEFETLSRDMDGYWWDNGKSLDRDFLKKSCLDNLELRNYIGFSGGYAIHISKLEVFDKPKRINDFIKYNKNHIQIDNCVIGFGFGSCERLTNAPQSWCYVEVD